MKLTIVALLSVLSLIHAQAPPNDDCANAIVVNPRNPIPIYGNNSLASLDNVREKVCSNLTNSSGLWYKFDSSSLAVVNATTCNRGTGTNFDTFISVFVGNNCDTLSCVDFNDDERSCPVSNIASTLTFIPEANKTYWIVVNGFGDSVGFFNMTLSTSPSTYVLMNSITDRPIQQLQRTITYASLPSSRLNIQAVYEPNISPRSVRMTFDNPPRNFCENTPPFSVFGDLNGDFFNATIPVGTHLVTSTPYNQSNCQGTAGPSLNRTFSLNPCTTSVVFVDVANNLPVQNSGVLDYLPCSLNIRVSITCGFPVKAVTLELRNRATNTLVVSRIERAAPYYLFGDVKGVPLSESLAPGNYSLTVVVDEIVMRVTNFVAVNECAKNIPPNDACVNAIPFAINSTYPFRAIGDTTFAVLDNIRERSCVTQTDGSSGLWYKFKNPPAPFLSAIVATTCSNISTFDTQISVFLGENCDSLRCLYSTSAFDQVDCGDTFASAATLLSRPNQTLWFLVNGIDDGSGVFQLKVESNPNVFFLVNPVTDRPFGVVEQLLSYAFLPVSRLNIQAGYDPAFPIPRSVRLTFDNPPSSICDNTAPFSVFGDLNGDFFNATIPVGEYTVTATPYNDTNCGGIAGPTRSQTFFLEPCDVGVAVLDVVRRVGVEFDEENNLAYLPCSVNVLTEPGCGFSPKEVKLELRNTVTNTLLAARTERTAPYYLFGDLNGVPRAERLLPGAYRFTIIADGIEMVNFEFAASGECV